MRRRRSERDRDRATDERTWSARPSAGALPGAALPAETGPIWAPDELSIWPVEGGRYGLDAHYHGSTGERRARHQLARLERVNLAASVRANDRGGATLRLGPLQHRAAWLALEAFLGRPLDVPDSTP